jgi:cytochrome P450 family 4
MSPILLSLLLLSVILTLVYWWRRRPLLKLAANLPGPPSVPIFGNALEFRSKDFSQNFRTFIGFMHQYGPVMKLWLGPQLITAISDPQHIEKLVAHDKFCTRGSFFTLIMKPMFRNGLLAIDGEIWRKHRKIVSAAFQNNTLDKFVGTFAAYSCILADRLSYISDGKFHNIYMYFSQCTLDVICDTAFGYKLSAQNKNRIEVVNSILSVLDHVVEHLLRPWLHFDWVHKLTKWCVKYTDVIDYLNSIIMEAISLRKEKYTRMLASGEDIQLDKMQNPILLDTLILNEGLDMDDILGEISSIAGAGAETTSSTCCFVLALLSEHQNCQEKVLEEQKAIFGDDIQRPVTREDLPQMLYLEQVNILSIEILKSVP